MLGPTAAAEDAAQEAAVDAWRAHASCRAENPEPWLRQIARREALRHGAASGQVDLDELAELGDPRTVDPVLRAGQRTEVAALLGVLEPHDRALLFMRFWLDWEPIEIARALRCPPGTVRARLHRLQARLRRELDDGNAAAG